MTLKSITAQRDSETDELIDLDGGAVNWYQNDTVWEHEQFSQELQLLATLDNLRLVGGLFYFEEETEFYRMQSFIHGFFMRHLGGKGNNENFAVYGQADWDVNEDWTLSFGARYTDETKDMDRYIQTLAPLTPFGAIPPDYSNPTNAHSFPDVEFDDTSIMASAAYNINDDAKVYVKYSEGFRSGGYDGATANVIAAGTPFDSEELASWEIGLKSTLFDGRVQANVAAFFNDYEDFQIGVFDGSVSITDNAGEVEIRGVELETRAAFTDKLGGFFNYGFLDYDIKKYDMGGAIGDVSDRAKLNNAPMHSYTLGFDYNLAKTEIGSIDLLVNYVKSDGAHAISISSSGAAPNSKTEDYELLNARLTLSEIALGSDMNMTVALWGKNLTDDSYYDNIIDWGGFGGFRSGTQGWPRTYGLEATIEF